MVARCFVCFGVRRANEERLLKRSSAMKRTSWISMLFLVVACGDSKPMTTGINLGDDDGDDDGEEASESAETGPKEDTGSPPVTGGPVATTAIDGESSSGDAATSDSETGPCGFVCPEETGDEGGQC